MILLFSFDFLGYHVKFLKEKKLSRQFQKIFGIVSYCECLHSKNIGGKVHKCTPLPLNRFRHMLTNTVGVYCTYV